MKDTRCLISTFLFFVSRSHLLCENRYRHGHRPPGKTSTLCFLIRLSTTQMYLVLSLTTREAPPRLKVMPASGKRSANYFCPIAMCPPLRYSPMCLHLRKIKLRPRTMIHLLHFLKACSCRLAVRHVKPTLAERAFASSRVCQWT
jgi:hypothetical protein